MKETIKRYLDARGENSKVFKNNRPGDDFITSFKERYKKELSSRLADNMKLNRDISKEAVKLFYDNLEQELEGVPPENIFNFDETAMVDDPGKVKVFVGKKQKYVYRRVNFSKQSFTVLFCGSASGTLLPPFVVYKADNLYKKWCEGGVKGARYGNSKSGWMDNQLFTDWFETLFLPWVKKLNGPKVLIGDNASSHFSFEVIQMCKDHNIRFVPLPPNATHLLQPLDVGLFRSMKGIWRKTIREYRTDPETRNQASILKSDFPRLVKNCLTEMEQPTDTRRGTAEVLKSAFKATGIFPYNRNIVLDKMKDEEDLNNFNIPLDQALAEAVQEVIPKANQKGRSRGRPSKKSRLIIEPGKSISLDDEEHQADVERHIEESIEAAIGPQQEDVDNLEDSYSEEDAQEVNKGGDEDEDEVLVELNLDVVDSGDNREQAMPDLGAQLFREGDMVVTVDRGTWSIAEMKGFSDPYIRVQPWDQCQTSKNTFQPGRSKRIKLVDMEMIKFKVNPVPKNNSTRYFQLSKEDYKKAEEMAQVFVIADLLMFVYLAFRNKL